MMQQCPKRVGGHGSGGGGKDGVRQCGLGVGGPGGPHTSGCTPLGPARRVIGQGVTYS